MIKNYFKKVWQKWLNYVIIAYVKKEIVEMEWEPRTRLNIVRVMLWVLRGLIVIIGALVIIHVMCIANQNGADFLPFLTAVECVFIGLIDFVVFGATFILDIICAYCVENT